MVGTTDKTGEQLTLEIAEKTRSRVIASSPLNFQIELMERVGEEDIPQLILISEHLVEEFHIRIPLLPGRAERLLATSSVSRWNFFPTIHHSSAIVIWEKRTHSIHTPLLFYKSIKEAAMPRL